MALKDKEKMTKRVSWANQHGGGELEDEILVERHMNPFAYSQFKKGHTRPYPHSKARKHIPPEELQLRLRMESLERQRKALEVQDKAYDMHKARRSFSRYSSPQNLKRLKVREELLPKINRELQRRRNDKKAEVLAMTFAQLKSSSIQSPPSKLRPIAEE